MALTGHAKCPIIGITTYGRADKRVDNPLFDTHYASPTPYAEAVRRAGGIPVLLPPGENAIADLIERLDGFVFSGGADIDPTRYGGTPDHPDLLPFSPDRDAYEFALVRALSTQGETPCLFICRGMQVLNVALGGTLHPHIPDIRDQDIHRGPGGGWTEQPVAIKPDTRLHTAMQTDQASPFSGHHQAVNEVAPGLRVSATAPDSIIEALERPDHSFFLGVQWHPEVSAATDETQQRIFDALIRAART
ncbi:gamma-glutamyl-gamma-aminobutyrate hydrolase family protein [uncultured Roseovarius sp.]|uniref:gamma-glutamyl-gamma-aminobutyrate hydrolase family protein n=1 Tax=uncultured Roseovarius sp. TaxID=293344 RepID=UPI002626278C|nr:gamma-glutamyl-gamma-aminobutyrate hydrolase family protein [uncultured Roseovarius sp.]